MTGHEWRYVERGQVKHALSFSAAAVAICGIGPRWFAPDWFGTGSQTEYERLAELPACRRCLARGATP